VKKNSEMVHKTAYCHLDCFATLTMIYDLLLSTKKSSEVKKKEQRQYGFVLTDVITAIAVIGIEMFVLAGISNIMQFKLNNAYLQACERKLIASSCA